MKPKVNRGPQKRNVTDPSTVSLPKAWWTAYKQFNTALGDTSEALQRTGDALVKLIEIEPNSKEIMIAMNPNLTLPFLDALESIGLGRTRADIILLKSGFVARVLASLDKSDQDKIFEHGLKCYKKGPDGKPHTEIKKPAFITVKDLTFSIKNGQVLNEEDSLKTQEEHEKKKHQKESVRYYMKGDMLAVVGGTFTPKEAKKMFLFWKEELKKFESKAE